MTCLRFVFTVSVSLIAACLVAQDLAFTLSSAEIDGLGPEASVLYREAASAHNHADAEGCHRALVQAAALAPSAARLQILSAEAALHMAERRRGEAALETLDFVKDACSRVLENETAPSWLQSRAMRLLTDAQTLEDEEGARVLHMRETGDAYMQHQAALQARMDAARSRAREQRATVREDAAGPNPLLLPSEESTRLFGQRGRQLRGEQGLLPASEYSRRAAVD
jgi:hypothetical protein